MRAALTAALLVALARAGHPQTDSLDRAAELAQRAWFNHDAPALVAGSPRIVVQLPGTDPSGALGQAQATALLRDYFNSVQEVETVVRSAREVEPGRGYVELLRRYRVTGTQDVRTQTLLLGYRKGDQGWVLTEIRASG
ncbi:MAG TPA: hypothetical protein VFW66_06005 [Gemmatimonadales bacterium]|nr:hypothetical protein [Gemmatimonadales bacterium]